MNEELIPVSVAKKNSSLLPQNIADDVANFVTSATFRNATNRSEQIYILRQVQELDFESIATVLGMAKTTVHRAYKRYERNMLEKEDGDKPGTRRRGNPLLTSEQEAMVIDWIRTRQRNQDCPTPTMIRVYAGQLSSRKDKDMKGEKMTRQWWHDFRLRHSDEIDVKVVSSIECARSKVKVEQIQQYASMIFDALCDITSGRQLLNFDETGFHQRIDKGSKRKCCYALDVDTDPRFQEESQTSTVSLVATINLVGESLKPLFLTKELVRYKSKTLQQLRTRLETFTTPRGYQNESSMLYYLHHIIRPYVLDVQKELGDEDASVYLVMDQCPSHMTERVKDAIKQIKGLRTIPLPPHSSHFTQPLDVGVFGILKRAYRNLRTGHERPKYEAKLLRAFHAWYQACFHVNIIGAWQMIGVEYRCPTPETTEIVLNIRKIVELMRTHCHDFSDELPDESEEM